MNVINNQRSSPLIGDTKQFQHHSKRSSRKTCDVIGCAIDKTLNSLWGIGQQ